MSQDTIKQATFFISLIALILIGSLQAKATPIGCSSSVQYCLSKPGLPCPWILQWNYKKMFTNSWVCDGGTVGSTSGCVADWTEDCCRDVQSGAGCVTPSCPCQPVSGGPD